MYGTEGFLRIFFLTGALQSITPDNNLLKLHRRSSTSSKISQDEKGIFFTSFMKVWSSNFHKRRKKNQWALLYLFVIFQYFSE